MDPSRRDFYLLQNGHAGYGTHTASHSMRAEFIALEVQLSRSEAARSPPSSSEVKSDCRGIYPFLCTFAACKETTLLLAAFNSECSWFSSVFPSKLCNVTSHQATTTSWYILSYSLPSTLSKLQGLLY